MNTIAKNQNLSAAAQLYRYSDFIDLLNYSEH
jgi:hypothetical protein